MGYYIKHFNVNVVDKESNKINKKTYLDFQIKNNPNLEKRQKMRADFNYDLNMKYFDSLDYNDFNKKLMKFVKKNRFVDVIDLNKYKLISGIYIIILDNYKQAYIGITNLGIKERIQSHWQAKKDPKRLIFGSACNSILSIDSFGALDTTRIFVKTNIYDPYVIEEKFVNEFDNAYLLNRTSGGIGDASTYTDDATTANVAIVANRKTRDFKKFIDENELKKKCDEFDIAYYYRVKENN